MFERVHWKKLFLKPGDLVVCGCYYKHTDSTALWAIEQGWVFSTEMIRHKRVFLTIAFRPTRSSLIKGYMTDKGVLSIIAGDDSYVFVKRV